MPSPVGHSLIGLAVGLGALVGPNGFRALLREAWARRGPLLGAVALANAPDIDYLPGILSGDLNRFHHLYTHTLGWSVIAAAAAWMALRAAGRRAGPWTFLLLFGLVGSHLAADWMTDDGRAPYSIMAWWPFSDAFTLSPEPVFMRLHKREWSEFAQWHNVKAVAFEVAVCLPLLLCAAAACGFSARGVDRRGPGGK